MLRLLNPVLSAIHEVDPPYTVAEMRSDMVNILRRIAKQEPVTERESEFLEWAEQKWDNWG